MALRMMATLGTLLALAGTACSTTTAPDDEFLDGTIRAAPDRIPGRAYLHVGELREPGGAAYTRDEVRVDVRTDATDIYVREPGTTSLRRGDVSDLVVGRVIRFWHGGVEYRTLPITFRPHRVEVTVGGATP